MRHSRRRLDADGSPHDNWGEQPLTNHVAPGDATSFFAGPVAAAPASGAAGSRPRASAPRARRASSHSFSTRLHDNGVDLLNGTYGAVFVGYISVVEIPGNLGVLASCWCGSGLEFCGPLAKDLYLTPRG